jgi:hypothetical protein
MPRWLTTLFLLLLFFVFVLPDPTGAGNAAGNALRSMGQFLESMFNSVSTNHPTGSVAVYPNGAVASGDGTAVGSDRGTAPLLGLEPPPLSETAPDLAPEAVLPYSPPVGLRIPSIGVASGFVPVGLDAFGALEVPPVADRVGWYSDSPTPGERGPAVATAHVDWKYQRGVFYDLGRLKSGDDVIVDRADGVAATFRVTLVGEYPKTQFPTDEVYGSTDAAELRLITCSGRFDSNTRSYDDNIVVFAVMVGMT